MLALITDHKLQKKKKRKHWCVPINYLEHLGQKCTLCYMILYDIILYYAQTDISSISTVLSSIQCTQTPPTKKKKNVQPIQLLTLASFYLCWERLFICDLNTSACDHLNALQERLSSVRRAHACFYSPLAEEMKYSWWRGGIGCRAKSVLTGPSRLRCILRGLLLSLSFSLYKTMSGGRENRQVRQCLH